MKRIFLLLIMSVLCLKVSSQAALFALIFGDKVATDNFNVSLEAGIGSSDISSLNYDSKRALCGQFGIGFNIQLNKNITLSPGAYFFSRRSVFVNDAPVYQGENIQIINDLEDATLILSYIDVPIKIAYTFSNSPWSVGIVPQLGINTGSTATYSFSNDEELSAKIEDAAEALEFGSQFFVARSFNFSGKKIMILGLRYYQGFSNALDRDFAISDGANRSNYIGASVSFPFIATDTDEYGD